MYAKSVLIVVFVSMTGYCRADHERHNLMAKIRKFETFDNRHRILETIGATDLQHVSTEGLQEYFEKLQAEIPCRYAYQTLVHVDILRTMFRLDVGLDRAEYRTLDRYFSLLQGHYKRMAHEVRDMPPVSELMWMFFTHMDRFERYWRAVRANSTAFPLDDALYLAHQALGKLLSEHLESRSCKKFYRKHRHDKMVYLRVTRGAYDDADGTYWKEVIDAETDALQRRRLADAADAAGTWSSYNDLSMAAFRLNDALANEANVRRIAGELIDYARNAAVGHRLSGADVRAACDSGMLNECVRRVSALQCNLLTIVQTIGLQYLLLYVRLANLMVRTGGIGRNVETFLERHKHAYYFNFLHILSMFRIENRDMERVADLLSQPMGTFMSNNASREDERIILKMLRVICKNLFYDIERHTNTAEVKFLRIKETIESMSTNMSAFVMFLQSAFQDVDFDAVQSYSRILYSIYLPRLDYYLG